MTDKKQYTTVGLLTVVTVTITATAQTLADLVGSAPTGRQKSDILQCTLLGDVTAGTDRDAVLYGGSDALGYIAAGAEKPLPVRGGNVFLKRAGGSDVTAQVEILWA